jgi:GNAT superfamily N-acetyltransferase
MAEPALVIRPAAEADLPAVLALYAEPGFDDGAVLGLDEAKAMLRRFAAYPDYTLFIAADGEEVVGTFALLVMDNLGHRGTPSAIVEDVLVAARRRGEGIGRAMMAEAARRAVAKGCYKLALSSNLKREAAHAFYASLGFEQHGVSFRIGLEASAR